MTLGGPYGSAASITPAPPEPGEPLPNLQGLPWSVQGKGQEGRGPDKRDGLSQLDGAVIVSSQTKLPFRVSLREDLASVPTLDPPPSYPLIRFLCGKVGDVEIRTSGQQPTGTGKSGLYTLTKLFILKQQDRQGLKHFLPG